MTHRSVLLQEVLQYTAPQKGEVVIDGTVGFAGHSLALCQEIGETGLLVGIDQDDYALSESEKTLQACPAKVELVKGNFRKIADIVSEKDLGQADIVLLDLGMSSFQIDSSERGFSFLRDEPLLMTMDGSADFTASDIINTWAEEEIANVIFAYGQEHFAKRIAKNIVLARDGEPITTTGQLVEIIEKSVPVWYRHKKTHPATKTFQALRIAVNDELLVLEEGLADAWQILKTGGRLAVITFHSLEAKIVKDFFNKQKKVQAGEIITKSAVKPTREEIKQNPRARSAQLRVIKKI